MLSLKWEDVYDFGENEFKSHVLIKEQKTGKAKKFLLNRNALEGLGKLRKQLEHIKSRLYF
jgi:hypothetical protein